MSFLFDYKLNRTSYEAERSVVLVISPLVSLMVDQVTCLLQRGVSAGNIEWKHWYVVCHSELLIVTVISTDVDKQLLASENDVTMGRFSLLYTAPEAIVHRQSCFCYAWRSEQQLC